jgi:glycosyltransferase involved in cell wall biosynthesis
LISNIGTPETGKIGGDLAKTLVIIAAKNEEKGVGSTVRDVKDHLNGSRILLVDGHSTDDTVRIAKDEGAEILIQAGIGKGKAIGDAVEAIDADAEYVVFMDADYTYPAEFVPQMIQQLEANPQLGMVSGNRFNGHFKLKAMHNILYFGNRALAFTHNLLNGVAMRDPLTGLRVIRAGILRGWYPKSQGFDVEVEMNHLVENKGYGIAEIPIYYRIRQGVKKLSIKDGFSILRRILKESF